MPSRAQRPALGLRGLPSPSCSRRRCSLDAYSPSLNRLHLHWRAWLRAAVAVSPAHDERLQRKAGHCNCMHQMPARNWRAAVGRALGQHATPTAKALPVAWCEDSAISHAVSGPLSMTYPGRSSQTLLLLLLLLLPCLHVHMHMY